MECVGRSHIGVFCRIFCSCITDIEVSFGCGRHLKAVVDNDFIAFDPVQHCLIRISISYFVFMEIWHLKLISIITITVLEQL